MGTRTWSPVSVVDMLYPLDHHASLKKDAWWSRCVLQALPPCLCCAGTISLVCVVQALRWRWGSCSTVCRCASKCTATTNSRRSSSRRWRNSSWPTPSPCPPCTSLYITTSGSFLLHITLHNDKWVFFCCTSLYITTSGSFLLHITLHNDKWVFFLLHITLHNDKWVFFSLAHHFT